MEEISISKFKATCLQVLAQVKKSGRPVLVTKRGEPIAQVLPPPPVRPKSRGFGCMEGTIEVVGDIVAPLPERDWEALR